MAWLQVGTDGSLPPAQRTLEVYFAAHPGFAAINRVADLAMETLGPMMWAALIVMSLWAEIFVE